jgi:RecA-family ATPase
MNNHDLERQGWKPLADCPLNEWMSKVDDNVQWVIPQFVPKDSLILISGPQKRAYKTWFANAIALSVASGIPIDELRPLEAGNVLFFQEEGSRLGTKQRVQGICNQYNIPVESLNRIDYYFWQRVKLDTAYWNWAIMKKALEKKPSVIIFDALTYMHLAEENSISEMAKVIDTLHNLRAQGTAVIFLAHLDKLRGEQKTADIDSQVRGASNVVNSYDLHLALRKYDSKDKLIDLTVRAREHEEIEYKVAWDIKAGKIDPVTKIKPIESVKLTIKLIDEATTKDAEANSALVMLPTNIPMKGSQIKALWDMPIGKVKRVQELLIARGELVKNTDNTYVRVIKKEEK